MKITVQVVLHADDDTRTVVREAFTLTLGRVPGLRNPAPAQGQPAHHDADAVRHAAFG
jgi:hypothetical protein